MFETLPSVFVNAYQSVLYSWKWWHLQHTQCPPTQYHRHPGFKLYRVDQINWWSCRNVLAMLKHSKQPETHSRVLWTFSEHNTGISQVLRAGLTPAALHPHCLRSAKSVPHLAPAKALVILPSTPGLSKHSPNYFLSASSQFLQAQLETHPCCSKAQPNSITTLKWQSTGKHFPRPFSPFCTLMICHRA